MAGIYGVFLKKRKIEKGLDFSSIDDPVKTDLRDNDNKVIIGRSVINKLNHDRFFQTQDKITICFEGVNLSDTIKSPEDYFSEYNTKGISFVKNLKGTYSGFIYDGLKQKLFVFNDNLATKSIYYYHDKSEGFIFSSELLALTNFLRKNRVSYSVNKDAVYMMALYGFILDDNTYAREIKSLTYSSLLTYDIAQNSLTVERLHVYSIKEERISYSDAIKQIDERMMYSVAKNWQKDINNNTKHLSLLSGGMDARTNILLAKEIGFKDISTITFGQSNSKDVEYAKQIAIGEELNHFLRLLDSPKYLVDNILENYVKPNGGMMMFQTSAHTTSTVNSFNLKEVSLLHTGQIGDALFGSFTKTGYDFHKNRGKIGYTGFISDNKLLDKIEVLPEILDKYQDLGLEMFTYEQRIINATIMGDRTLNNTVDNLSPFYDRDLIDFCLSLPKDYKKNQLIYFDWLRKYHKQILKYPWDKIDMVPNNRLKIVYGKKFKKYRNGALKYFNLKYDSMNPYQQWLQKDLSIITTLDEIITLEIDKSYINEEMKNDLEKIYSDNIFEFRNKFAVATALLALKIHFD